MWKMLNEITAVMNLTTWLFLILIYILAFLCRSQCPRGLRRRSTAARLLRSWVRIPPVSWMFVCCDCCVLSGRGLCDELITRPEESHRLWCVVVCDLETSRIKSHDLRWVAVPQKKNLHFYETGIITYLIQAIASKRFSVLRPLTSYW